MHPAVAGVAVHAPRHANRGVHPEPGTKDLSDENSSWQKGGEHKVNGMSMAVGSSESSSGARPNLQCALPAIDRPSQGGPCTGVGLQRQEQQRGEDNSEGTGGSIVAGRCN